VDEQLTLCLDWGREPWSGQSPRMLTTHYSPRKLPEAARPEDQIEWCDPAQYTLFLKGKSDGS